MGRKSAEELQKQADEDNGLTEQYQAEKAVLSAAKVMEIQAKAHQMIGCIKGLGFAKQTTSIAQLKLIMDLKESKQYRGMFIPSDDGGKEINTWEEFCRYGIGYSPDTIDNNIKNLRVLGEEFMEHSQRLGLNARTLEKLSKLPDEAREEIIENVEVEKKDKGELIDLIEEMSARHSAERERLKKKNAAMQEDLDAKNKVLKAKSDALQQREEVLAKLEAQLERKSSPDQITEQQQNDINRFTTDIINRLYELEMVIYEVKKRDDAPDHLNNLTADSVNRLVDRLLEIRNRYEISGDLMIDNEDFINVINGGSDDEQT